MCVPPSLQTRRRLSAQLGRRCLCFYSGWLTRQKYGLMQGVALPESARGPSIFIFRFLLLYLITSYLSFNFQDFLLLAHVTY